MNIFLEVDCLAVIHKEFDDNEGQRVSYDEVYLLNERETGEREVIRLNSKLEGLAAYEGKSVVVQVDIDPTGTKKPRLLSIKDGN